MGQHHRQQQPRRQQQPHQQQPRQQQQHQQQQSQQLGKSAHQSANHEPFRRQQRRQQQQRQDEERFDFAKGYVVDENGLKWQAGGMWVGEAQQQQQQHQQQQGMRNSTGEPGDQADAFGDADPCAACPSSKQQLDEDADIARVLAEIDSFLEHNTM